jgi:uncharacterized membrane protein YebE (DUF533 family)
MCPENSFVMGIYGTVLKKCDRRKMMAGIGDLVGMLLQGGLSSSGANRVDNAMSERGIGQPGGLPEQRSGASGGSLLDGLMNSAKDMLSDAGQSRGGSNTLKAGGLGSLAGALLGGGSDSVKGAMGGGAMGLLAGLAFQAFQNMNRQSAGGSPSGFSSDELPLGLRAPASESEEKELESTATLILKGMISAAKSDGSIDNKEMQKIVGKLREGGADDELQQFVLDEMSKPMDLEGLVSEIPDQAVAAQVYAASLFAIEVDTAAERYYLAQLAQQTGLDQDLVQQLHNAVGVD